MTPTQPELPQPNRNSMRLRSVVGYAPQAVIRHNATTVRIETGSRSVSRRWSATVR